MSEQEFVTPEQKHKWAEWKCPTCGEDGIWQKTAYWPAPNFDPTYDVFRSFHCEQYWCETCDCAFDGSVTGSTYPYNEPEGH